MTADMCLRAAGVSFILMDRDTHFSSVVAVMTLSLSSTTPGISKSRYQRTVRRVARSSPANLRSSREASCVSNGCHVSVVIEQVGYLPYNSFLFLDGFYAEPLDELPEDKDDKTECHGESSCKKFRHHPPSTLLHQGLCTPS